MDVMFDGSLNPEEGEHQLAELEAESVVPPPLFLPSPSPDTATSSYCPDPSASSTRPNPSADSSHPDLSAADSELVSATDALDRMSMDLVASAALTNVKGQKSATAVVVEFAHQRTPPCGRVILPLGPGMGQMLTVRSPMEQNGAGKTLEDPPELLPGNVLVHSLPLAAASYC